MTIGFIGVGNIAAALVEGWCTADGGRPEIVLSPRNAARSLELADRFTGVKRLESNQEVLDSSEIVIVAVRPTIAAGVLGPLRFRPDHTVVSLVALLKYDELLAHVQPAGAVCRAIPMPAAAQHHCPIALHRPTSAVEQLFRAIGTPLVVDSEAQLHALWTLTGLITPFYELLADLSGWAATHGVQPSTAKAYVTHLFESLAWLAQHSPQAGLETLAKHAATPGGLNEQAGREIGAAGAHRVWLEAADRLLQRFR